MRYPYPNLCLCACLGALSRVLLLWGCANRLEGRGPALDGILLSETLCVCVRVCVLRTNRTLKGLLLGVPLKGSYKGYYGFV